MSLHFVKMQGAGNDFVILDEDRGEVKEAPTLARQLCRRRLGIGADGLVVLTPLGPDRARVRFYNPDGSRAEMCGNGMRCAAHYLRWRRGVTAGLVLETDVGPRRCEVTGQAWSRSCQVQVEMGRIEVTGVGGGDAWHGRPVELGAQQVVSYAIGVGNPHLVLLRRPDPGEVAAEGPALSTHPAFTDGVNVEWAELIEGSRVRAAVYERGAGVTQACGSGACAVVASLILDRQIDAGQQVAVELPGGTLLVTVDGDWNALLEGPSELVYEGVRTTADVVARPDRG